jgi:IKI3 family
MLLYLASTMLNMSPSETTPNLVEDAVNYIIFLVDADTLFNVALGMYDFSLVLMIAQHAQKVRARSIRPASYIPLINPGSQRVSAFPSGAKSSGQILSAI